jgi:hypothetical protein
MPLGLSSLFKKKNTIMNPKNCTVQPGDAFEDAAFKSGFEIVKF